MSGCDAREQAKTCCGAAPGLVLRLGPNLFALMCAAVGPNVTELVHTPVFAEALRATEPRFDRVVVDSTTVVVVADDVVVSTQVAETLPVVKDGDMSRDAVLRAQRTLVALTTPVFCAVLNTYDLSGGDQSTCCFSYSCGQNAEDGESSAA